MNIRQYSVRFKDILNINTTAIYILCVQYRHIFMTDIIKKSNILCPRIKSAPYKIVFIYINCTIKFYNTLFILLS